MKTIILTIKTVGMIKSNLLIKYARILSLAPIQEVAEF